MIYGRFDNRNGSLQSINTRNPQVNLLRRLKARARGKRLPLFSGGGMHLRVPIQGRSIVYTYIRKNGCSAFKKWLRDCGGYETSQRETLEMTKRYQVSFGWEVSRSDFLLVLRDPAARVASLFRNKLIQRSYADGFLENVKLLTDQEPDNMTFRTFLEGYIGENISREELNDTRIDVHARPQHLHLWPVVYNKVVLLTDLPNAARDLFPESVSQMYFRRQRNSSSSTLADDNASDVCVRELREHFLSTGVMPSDTALFDQTLQTSVRTIYENDYHLLNSSFSRQFT